MKACGSPKETQQQAFRGGGQQDSPMVLGWHGILGLEWKMRPDHRAFNRLGRLGSLECLQAGPSPPKRHPSPMPRDTNDPSRQITCKTCHWTRGHRAATGHPTWNNPPNEALPESTLARRARAGRAGQSFPKLWCRPSSWG